MDRKGILGLVLAIAGLVSWQIYYGKQMQKAQRAQAEAAAAAAAAQPAAAESAPAAPTANAAPASPAAPAAAHAEEERAKLATSTAEYEFTNFGGGLARVRLLNHNAEADEKVQLNEFGAIAIGATSEIAGEGTREPFKVQVDPASQSVVFERTDARQLQTTKRFTVPKLEGLEGKERLRQEYASRLELTFTNRGTQSLQIPAYFVHTGSAGPIHARDLPIYTGFNFFHGSNKFIDVNWFNPGGMLFWSRPERPVFTESSADIRWAGVTNQYFTTLVTPDVDEASSKETQTAQRGTSTWARRFTVPDDVWQKSGHSLEGQSGVRYAVDGALGMPGFTLEPGKSRTQAFQIYTGPREYRRLDALGNYEAEIMNFGMFGIVSKTLLNTMNTLRAWLGNYAIAIVVLTLLIKSLLWPLQNKATVSMKRMQALQPKMNELREKYKDDPTRMNTELMRLYKEHNINPMSGCLPMLVQIPIFFGFYNMLGKAVELRNSKFLWVHDLSQPDTVAHLFGFPVNVLPLCMAVTMFWQMAIQPKSGDPVQQRVFMFMPLIFIFFCYNFASALALYWTVQNLFSIVQLYATRNRADNSLQIVQPAKKRRS